VAKRLVLDAHILMRAVLGTRVAQLISDYVTAVTFLTAEEACKDAATYLPEICANRGLEEAATQAALKKLDALRRLIRVIPPAVFAHQETAARERLQGRDADDWPYLGLAMVFDCPLWTEDRDFFGCGIPLWTTDRVELYLKV
jgi:predicted nucleic acid-binding protein